jgi:PAS domain S-box-containing protein
MAKVRADASASGISFCRYRLDKIKTIIHLRESTPVLMFIRLFVSGVFPEDRLARQPMKIEQRKTVEEFRTGQNRVLEMIARGVPVEDTLINLVHLIESQSEGMLGSILLASEDGQCLRHGFAPSLPDAYNQAVEGIRVGPQAGSCGTAAHRKETVIVSDIQMDPLWRIGREQAAQHGLRACWSAPILSPENKVLGTFAMYYREVRSPSPAETELISIASQLAGIALMRKRTEEELFNSRQMLRTILDTIPQRVFWKDRNSVYVGCNKPLAEDCGYKDPGEIIGKTDYETKSVDMADLYRADDQKVMTTGQPKLNYEEPQIRDDGQKAWLMTSKVPLRDRDGQVIGVLGTYEDITERKRLEERVRQSQKMDAFGQLAAGVAHDFNNILTVIQGNLSLMQLGGLSPAEHNQALEQALTSAERAAELTRQLLTFGRRQIMQPKELDLNEVIVNMTKMLRRLIGANITLETDYAPGGAPVHADLSMMEQLVMNLVVNSRDAMPKGGRIRLQTATLVVTREQVKSKLGQAGEHIRLTVSDSGCGIEAQHMPHIFEPFFTTKEVGKGTGLGLATVFGIVEQHQGWIEVQSEVKQGTTFHIYLPRSLKTS